MIETKDIILVLIDVGMALGFYKLGGLPLALASLAGSIFYFAVIR